MLLAPESQDLLLAPVTTGVAKDYNWIITALVIPEMSKNVSINVNVLINPLQTL